VRSSDAQASLFRLRYYIDTILIKYRNIDIDNDIYYISESETNYKSIHLLYASINVNNSTRYSLELFYASRATPSIPGL